MSESAFTKALIKENLVLREALRPFARVFDIALVGRNDHEKASRYKGRGMFEGRSAVLTVNHFRVAARVLRHGAKPTSEDQMPVDNDELCKGLTDTWMDALDGLDKTSGVPCAMERIVEAAKDKARKKLAQGQSNA